MRISASEPDSFPLRHREIDSTADSLSPHKSTPSTDSDVRSSHAITSLCAKITMPSNSRALNRHVTLVLVCRRTSSKHPALVDVEIVSRGISRHHAETPYGRFGGIREGMVIVKLSVFTIHPRISLLESQLESFARRQQDRDRSSRPHSTGINDPTSNVGPRDCIYDHRAKPCTPPEYCHQGGIKIIICHPSFPHFLALFLMRST